MDFSRLLHTWIWQYWYMDFSIMLYGFVKIHLWISRSCYMDLSTLIQVVIWICQIGLMELFSLSHGFVKVALCISRSLPNKTKLKFDQDFNACWNFRFELEVLNESKYSMPRVRCAFGNVFIVQNAGEENTLSSLNPFSSALCLPLAQMLGLQDTTHHCHKLHSMLLLILHCIIIYK